MEEGTQVIQTGRYVRMVRAEALFFDSHGATYQRFGFSEVANVSKCAEPVAKR